MSASTVSRASRLHFPKKDISPQFSPESAVKVNFGISISLEAECDVFCRGLKISFQETGSEQCPSGRDVGHCESPPT